MFIRFHSNYKNIEKLEKLLDYIGDRSRKSARKLWASLPTVYRQCAVAYTDFWVSYEKIIPPKRHRAIGKETGQTNHIERLNNILTIKAFVCKRFERCASDFIPSRNT